MENILISKCIYVCLLIALVLGCRQKTDNKIAPQVQGEDQINIESDSGISYVGETIVFSEGDNLEWDESGKLRRHTLVKDGRPVYQASYKDQKKTDNKLLPWIQDAFLFEDKYYLKVYFPFPYQGKVHMELNNDPEYVLTSIEQQKYQLVINHALDLDKINFNFHYMPADADTLIETRFSYSYVIMTVD
jgi:hypothetical protein